MPSSRTPIAFMAGSCRVEAERRQRLDLVERALLDHARRTASRCARPARRRSGSMTMKRALSRSISGRPRSACHSRIDRPDASSTSSARTMRWPSPGFSVMRRRRILAQQDAVQLPAARFRQARSASGRGPLSECPAFPKCLRPAHGNRARCRRRRSAAARQAHRPSTSCMHVAQPGAGRIGDRRDGHGRREDAARARVRPPPAARSARRAPNRPAWNRR